MKIGNVWATRRTGVLAAVLFLLLVTWGMFHGRIQQSLTRHLLVSSETPNPDTFADLARKAQDPVEFLERCWATGKVAQRQLVASFLKENAAAHLPWMDRAQPLLRACIVDADASVRELGLAALDQLHSPLLFESAALQLGDLDPLVRFLGLEYLRKSEPKFAVPLLIRLLDDADLRNVTTAEIALARFSGEDFGVRASQAVQVTTDEATNSAALEAIHRGVEKRKQWWREHQRDYVANGSDSDSKRNSGFSYTARPSAPDFSLRNLEGKRVKLSDFRGKVVLVNFWATWCTACLKEIPDLVALQEKMGNKIAIVGIALDGVPDEDGDNPSEEGQLHQKEMKPPKSTRPLVEGAVKLRHINYPVLLDPKGTVGGQYNGGELPTTVIFDSEGRVRRRFIGERSLAVFESMIAAASEPPVAFVGRSQMSEPMP